MSNPELPGYELLERLSGKSVWNVFKARQLSLNRMVVVKFLPAALLGDEGENKPFISETRRVALIKHPNIVQIYDFGRTGDHYFSVIEFVDGYSLATWLNKVTALPSHTALLVTEGVAKALAFAWDKAGATHGAIKPNNILVDADGIIKVTDFGLNVTMRLIQKKQSGAPAPAAPLFLNYTAPEHRIEAADADCRVDIYALGALLYHMVCGQPPPADTPSDCGPNAQAVKPGVPVETVRLIQKFMAPNREHRPRDWGEALQDILRVKSGNSPFGNFPQNAEQPASAMAAVPPKRRTVSVIVKAKPKVAKRPSKAPGALMAGLSRLWSSMLAQRQLHAFLIVIAALAIGWLLFHSSTQERVSPQPSPRRPPPQRASPDAAPPLARTPSAPPAERTSPPEAAGKYTELDNRSRLDEILQWGRDNPDKPDKKMAMLAELARRRPQTPSSIRAAGEADRMRKQLIEETVAEVRAMAQALAAENRFEEAANLCRNYRGPLAEETAEARAELADSFIEEEKTRDRNRQTAAEQADRQFRNTVAAAVDQLMSDNAPEALKLVEAAGAMPAAEPHRAELKAFESSITMAGMMEEAVLRSFLSSLNRNVRLELAGGVESLIITNVAEKTLYCDKVIRVGGGEIRVPRNIAFNELALPEIVRRIPRTDPAQAALLIGMFYLQAGDEAQAARHFAGTGAFLAPILDEYLKSSGAKRAERNAEETLIQVFRSANIILEEGPFSVPEALSAIARRQFTPREALSLAQQASAYRARHGQTLFAQRAEPVLKAMDETRRGAVAAGDSTPTPGGGTESSGAGETPPDATESFHARFEKLNPNVTRWQVQLESDSSGNVTGVEIVSSRLKDLSPLAVFSNLTKLTASGSGALNMPGMVVDAPLKDLSPIAGARLEELDIGHTMVRDLSPLRGMPIRNLNIQFTAAEDISPLKGMPLVSLNMDGVSVRNFEALVGAPLQQLSLNSVQIYDVSPLKKLPLTQLSLRDTRVPHITGLQGMRLTHLDLSRSKVGSLEPLRNMPLAQLFIDGTPVSDLRPLAGAQLATLSAASSKVKDLSPLRGMPLTKLNLESTEVSDLTPLAGAPLEWLNLNNTKVRDLSPLRNSRLKTLSIQGTEVKTLSPIRSLPIEELFVDDPAAFKDDLDGMQQGMLVNPKPGDKEKARASADGEDASSSPEPAEVEP